MNSKNQNTSLFQKDQVIESLKQSFVKQNPKIMIKNPIMFTVEVSTLIMLFVTVYSAFSTSQGSFGHSCISPWQYNHVIQRLWTL